jgi:hypothetical protein
MVFEMVKSWVHEQIVNADQSLMDEETLGAIYLGKKKTSSLGTNRFSYNEACYQVILPYASAPKTGLL